MTMAGMAGFMGLFYHLVIMAAHVVPSDCKDDIYGFVTRISVPYALLLAWKSGDNW